MSDEKRSGSPVVVGEITSVYGVKGWVKVRSFMQEPAEIFQFENWLLADKSRVRPWSVAVVDAYRLHGKGFVAHIKGCDDRDSAAAYAQLEIAVGKDSLPDLADDEVYWADLEGLLVFNLKDEALGVVECLMETGANAVLVVKPCEGSADQQERLIPYVPGPVVKQVSLDERRIIVDWELDY